MPKNKDKSKGRSFLEAWKNGKETAAFIVMLAALGHSLYATYIKTEDEARAVFATTTKSVEDFSGRVDVQVGELKGRVDTLEKLVLSLQHRSHESSAPRAALPAIPSNVRTMLLDEMAESPASTPGIMDELDSVGVDPLPVPVIGSDRRLLKAKKESAGLSYKAPRAPWEQRESQ